MDLLKKLTVLLIAIVFCLSMAVSSSNAQRGRYWRGDNGNHYGWYKNRRWRRGYVSYRRYPRYYYSYYPRRRYVRYYRTYPRYYGYDPYPRYYYPYRRRSGVSINFNFR